MVVHWLDEWMTMRSNLDRHELNFIFAKFSFGMNVKGQRKT